MKKRTERNRPVATLMKEFSGHDNKKKAVARKELHRRFDYLDYSQQIKILLAHLDSVSNDRKWAYTRLIDYWEPCFIAPVLKLWESYHEPRCTWSMVQHFPKEYIIENIDILTVIPRNYYYICLRFGRDDDFTIDKTKLAPYDLIRLAYKTGLPLSYDEVMQCLFSIIEKACNDWGATIDIEEHIMITAGDDRFVRFKKDNIPILEYACYYVSKMEMSDIIQYMDAWIDGINVTLGKDKEWMGLNQLVLKDMSFNYKAIAILKRIMLRHIPQKYRSQASPITHNSDYESKGTEGNKSPLDDLIGRFDLIPDAPF